MTYQRIGEELGRSRGAVAGMLNRLGVLGMSRKLISEGVKPCPDKFINKLNGFVPIPPVVPYRQPPHKPPVRS